MAVRVVQWATGAVGCTQLQEIIQSPAYELVGVLVYSDDKRGRDAGELCGLSATTGIKATTDKEEILALAPDVVLHAASKAHPGETNAEDICELLAAGINVITTTSYNHLPTYGPELERAFADACASGGSRFHAAGENPGFMMERLVATVTGLTRRIDRIDLYEATDVSGISSRSMLIDLMGMGRRPEAVSIGTPVFAKLDTAYRQALSATADVLGASVVDIDKSVECTTLPHDISVAAGTIEAGTVVGQRFSWQARCLGGAVLAIHEEWVLTRDLPQWGLKPLKKGERIPLIRAVISGLPGLELQLDVGWDGAPPVELAETSPGHLMIGMTAIRAIPDVLAAPPGIVKAPVFGAMHLT